MSGPRVGSLFSGTGALDLAVHQVLNAEPAWFVENDPAASKVLAHHWSQVPNYGDVTAVDWAQVEPVDLLAGGFPCTDVSSAGKRAGLRPGTRSGLWSHMAYAISVLRPRLVVIENVRGLLSTEAHRDVEPGAEALGDGPSQPVLRALGAVLGDLSDCGYVGRWVGLRAADVGAPHGRFRVFITAWPAAHSPDFGHQWGRGARHGWAGPADGDLTATDTSGGELQRWGVGGVLAGPQGTGEGERPERERDRHATGDGRAAPADTPCDGRGEGRPEPAGLLRGSDAALGGDAAAADASCAARGGAEPEHLAQATGRTAEPGERTGAIAWGDYGPAIRRWERALGRLAPAPTVLSGAYLAMIRRRKARKDHRPVGMRGSLAPRRQLSPAFTEWMMGWPQGWVTAVPGLSRNEQLKLCGNGVVPAQCIAALRWLLSDEIGRPAA